MHCNGRFAGQVGALKLTLRRQETTDFLSVFKQRNDISQLSFIRFFGEVGGNDGGYCTVWLMDWNSF